MDYEHHYPTRSEVNNTHNISKPPSAVTSYSRQPPSAYQNGGMSSHSRHVSFNDGGLQHPPGHRHAQSSDLVRAIPSDPSYPTQQYSNAYRHGRQGSGHSRIGSGDDGITIGPFDSISNAGDRDPNEAVRSFTGKGWQSKDPYATNDYSHIRKSDGMVYGSRHRSDSNGANTRDSVSELPLIDNAAATGYAGHNPDGSFNYNNEGYDDSMIDGDSVIPRHSKGTNFASAQDYYNPNAYYDSEAGRPVGYPPAPYDSPDKKPDDEEFHDKDPSLMNTIRGKESEQRPNVWLRQLRDTTPVDQKIQNHRKGIGVQDHAWACYVFSVVLLIVFIVELVKSSQVTGSPISTSPFNYMIGPSTEMLINLGARFTGCMREVAAISNVSFACLNSSTSVCTLEDICGFGGFGESGTPNQEFRFFTPLWLHVGVVHLILNTLVLLTSSRLVEKQMGTLKFVILYIVTGVFGFVLGGNFALSGLASMGASGAIFGTHAAVLVDLCAHWNLHQRPGRMLLALMFEIIVGIGIGYIPGVDNFSHIGGFAMGLLLSIILLPAIHQTKRHRITFYVLRVISLVGACVLFGVLVNNFYTQDPNSACEWCRYLSCWPTASNNRCKGTGLTTTTTTTSTSSVDGGLLAIYIATFFSTTFWSRNKSQW